MSDSIVLDFLADGGVEAMHKDKFPLGFLGKQTITRASEIKFNDDTQKWDIHLPDTGEIYSVEGWHACDEARGFDGYDVAREIEVAWLDGCRLESVSPLSTAGLTILKAKRKEKGV